MRERQAREQLALFGNTGQINEDCTRGGASGPDVMYESVNYDEIKSAVAAGGGREQPPLLPDQQSLASDLYAEIGSDGANSTRSSAYVRVGDIRPDVSAPTPPPVDFLRNISAHGKKPLSSFL